MCRDLRVLIWDDTKTSRVAEVMQFSTFVELKESGVIRDNSTIERTNVNQIMETTANHDTEDLHTSSIDLPLGDQGNNNQHSIEPSNEMKHETDGEIDDPNTRGSSVEEQVSSSEEVYVETLTYPGESVLNPADKIEVKSTYLHFPHIEAKINLDGTIRIVKAATLTLQSCEQLEVFQSIPEEIIERDKQLYDDFNILYNVTLDVGCLEQTIGGRVRTFLAFHYPEGNAYPSNDRKGRSEYVEQEELQLLYRYDIKSAVSFSYLTKNKEVQVRFLFTYCYLACNPSTTKYAPRRFILVSILTTLCVSPFNVYVVWDTLLNAMVEWHGEHLVRYFWSDTSEHVDYTFLRENLDLWFLRRKFYYDRTRTIPRDYHYPGNMDRTFDVKPDIAEKKFNEWKLTCGLRKVSDLEALPKRQSKQTHFFVTKPTTTYSISDDKEKNPKARKKRSNPTRLNNDSKFKILMFV
jgi:hypothetical protein